MHHTTGSGCSEQSKECDEIAEQLGFIRGVDAKLSKALELRTCLKPEVALMLELYEAYREGRSVTVSVLGLIDGIPATTTLRYLEALQKKGAVKRVAHETDNRMTYVQITDAARAVIDEALGG